MKFPSLKQSIIIILSVVLFSILALFVLEFLSIKILYLYHSVILLYLEHLKTSLKLLPIFTFAFIFLSKLDFSIIVQKLNVFSSKNNVWLLLSLGLFFIFTNIISYFAYYHLPQGDATWVFFQTKVFAAGKLFAPAPLLPEFFPSNIIVLNGKWFSYTSPGQSLVLLPFYLLSIPWITGPLLGTLTLYLIYKIGSELFGKETGDLLLFLGLFSPFMLFLFASYDFHTSSLFFTTLALYFTFKFNEKRILFPILTGISLGLVFLSRPYTAIAVSIPILIYLIIKKQYQALLFIILGAIPSLLFQFYYNYELTGNLFRIPYRVVEKVHNIGFFSDIGQSTYGIKGHNLLKALINLFYNIFVLSFQLFGWFFFSLVFFILSFIKRKKTKEEFLLYGIFVSLIVFHLFYWFHGITPWGTKYLTEALPSLIILSSVGIMLFSRFKVSIKVSLIILALIYNLFFYIPKTFSYFQKGKWGETPEIHQAVKASNLKNAIIFVKEREEVSSINYKSTFIFNDPFFRSNIIYAVDLLNKDTLLMKQFPNKKSYIYDCTENKLLPYLFRDK